MRYFWLAVTAATVLCSCSPDDSGPGPDCTKVGANAELKIYATTRVPGFERFEQDTFLVPSTVVMDGDGSRGSTTWRIGQDQRDFAGQQRVALYFEQEVTQLPVKLITRGETSSACPQSVPQDSAQLSVTTRRYPVQTDGIEYFQGSFADNPTDTFTIAFDERTTLFVRNFPKGYVGVNQEDTWGYKRHYIHIQASINFQNGTFVDYALECTFSGPARNRVTINAWLLRLADNRSSYVRDRQLPLFTATRLNP